MAAAISEGIACGKQSPGREDGMRGPFDVVVVGGGIAGSALATTLARGGLAVGVLERDLQPVDRVRGEFMAPWGVVELKRLGLLDALVKAGGLFTVRTIPYDENRPGDAALPYALRFSDIVPDVPGCLCMGHPAMCSALASEAKNAGVAFLTGIEDIDVVPGTPPVIAFSHSGKRVEWKPRLIVGADGRNSRVRQQLGFKTLADPPHHLIGGMLVEGVSDWQQDIHVIGTEGRVRFFVFPQGGDRARLYLCYNFADKADYAGPNRQQKVIEAFANLKCLPQAGMIGDSRPLGPFNSFSNEDHWVENPTAPGVVLIGDAAGHNDPVTGQGLSIALRDVRLVGEVVLAGQYERDAFRSYVEERLERMRRLRIAARFVAQIDVEFGEEARRRRERVFQRTRNKMPSPRGAAILGPEKLPANFFEQSTIEALLAP
jgi:2-polyprenyl-6-methoxyphenol hydroxylase-like FAD-dependent oxidoreductase